MGILTRLAENGIKGISLNIGHNQYTTCPECSEDRKKKTAKCLSVIIENEGTAWNCHHCGWTGGFSNKEKPVKIIESEPIPAITNDTKLSDKALDWFRLRGITKATLKRNKIYTEKHYMPQVKKEVNCVCFPFFKDNKVVNIKYRDGAKNFTQLRGAERVFYGLDDIKKKKEIIIVEGEIDKLSWEEAGVKNVISVPTGAPSPKSNNFNNEFEYIGNCHEYFKELKKCYLAVDEDTPGILLRNELARRIGKEICYLIRYPEGCKDANDVLVKHGTTTLKKCLNDAEPYPVEGIHRVADYEKDILSLYNNGCDTGITVGYDIKFDNCIQFVKSMLYTITGIPSHGKSNLMEQLSILLAARQGWKFGVFSPEHYPFERLFLRLAKIFTGQPFFDGATRRMSETKLMEAMEFINKHYMFIYPEEDFSLDAILEAARVMVLRDGIDALIIDPWNEIAHEYGKQSEHEYTGEALRKIHQFKRKYDVAVFIVAHPTKLKKNENTGLFYVPNLYSISGSAHWYNKVDFGLTVYRNFKTGDVEVYIQKVKYEHLGKIDWCVFKFNSLNSRYYEDGANEDNTQYSIKSIDSAGHQVWIPNTVENRKQNEENIRLPYKDDEDSIYEKETDTKEYF